LLDALELLHDLLEPLHQLVGRRFDLREFLLVVLREH
jgi:hypothetical protein